MNEQQMTALMERAGATLDVDVADLVARGTARGRSRRRRRTAGAVLVGATVVAAAAAAPVLLADDGEQPTTVAEATTRTPIDREDMDPTLVALLPGSRITADDAAGTRFPTDPYDPQVQRATVRWHGATVGVSVDSRGLGIETSAQERCESVADRRCEQEADGSWSFVHRMYDFDTETDEMGPGSRVLQMWTQEGYVVVAESTPVSAGVGTAELRDLALSDAWWR